MNLYDLKGKVNKSLILNPYMRQNGALRSKWLFHSFMGSDVLLSMERPFTRTINYTVLIMGTRCKKMLKHSNIF